MTRVDLLVPELVERDAIGTHSLLLRDVLVGLGVDVRFVTQIPTELEEPAVVVDRWRDPADLVILQHGIGSLLADAVIRRKVPCVLNYHNITPLEFVEPWNPDQIAGLRWGRAQIHELAPLTRRAVCDSRYNAAELLRAGYDDVRVAPVLWRAAEVDEWEPDPDPIVLFVGRVASNKCHQDVIAAHAALTETHPTARAVFVGAEASVPYHHALVRYAQRLGVDDRVTFVGSVDDDELRSWYSRARVFVCLSEHEGFCVPLIEAMGAGVPVVGYRAAAVPETIAGAGIVLADKAPMTVATAVRRILDDERLAEHLSREGRRRAADFALDQSATTARAALVDLVAV